MATTIYSQPFILSILIDLLAIISYPFVNMFVVFAFETIEIKKNEYGRCCSGNGCMDCIGRRYGKRVELNFVELS